MRVEDWRGSGEFVNRRSGVSPFLVGIRLRFLRSFYAQKHFTIGR